MAQTPTPRKRPTAAERKAAAAADKPIHGVLVARTFDKDGNVCTTVQCIGDVKVTEVATILEIGLKGFRKNIALDE
jgi:hypothetical protein